MCGRHVDAQRADNCDDGDAEGGLERRVARKLMQGDEIARDDSRRQSNAIDRCKREHREE